MELIGRQEELGLIKGFLDSISAFPRGLMLIGEAGIGKTALWDAGVEAARQLRWQVLACRAAQSEARLSYSAVGDLLTSLDDKFLTDLPIPQREALDAALLRSKSAGPTVDRRAVSTALLTILGRLASRGPVLLAIDDFHWLDRPSAQAIDFAVRRVDGPVGVLISTRVDHPSDEPLIRLDHPDAMRRQEVGPLSLAAIHHLLRQRTGRTYSRPTLMRIHASSGGNPLFALELARALGDGTVKGSRTEMPSTLAELVRRRIEALDSPVQKALLYASALASPTVDVLERALGPKSVGLLEQAEAAGIVEITGNRVQFAHPILAAGVYATALRARRRAAHAALAPVVSDIEEKARHLALAATSGGIETISALDIAAEQAAARGASAAAAELLELALDLGARDPSRVIAAAKHHFDAGDTKRARRLLDSVLASTPGGDLRARASLLIAHIHLQDDSYLEASTALEAALADAATDQALLLVVQLELSFVLYNLGRLEDAISLTEGAVEQARKLYIDGLLALALSLFTIYRFMGGVGPNVESMEAALRMEDPAYGSTVWMRPSLHAGLIWMWLGQLDKAHATMESLRRESVERGLENDLLFLDFQAETLACWRGDLTNAQQIARESYERALQCGTEIQLGLALCSMSHAAAYVGDASEARRSAEASFEILRRGALATVSLAPLATLGFIELSLEDYHAAANRLAPMAATALALGVREPSMLPFAPDGAEALIATGRLEEARGIIDWLEEHGRRLDRPWALAAAGRCRSLLLASEGDVERAVGCCERALSEHDRLAMPFERGRTLLVLGQLQRKSGKRRAARASLDGAFEIFKGMGAALWAEKARRELGRLGIQRGAAGELTPTERRVAELAAAGHTNRQVAAALLISPKTVEANLARIYQKLEIRSRAELGRRMAVVGIEQPKGQG